MVSASLKGFMVNSANKDVIAVLVLILVALAAVFYLNQPDPRTPGQKLGDAVNALPHGPNAAARQLESRTKGQRLGDKIKKATSGR
jgi:hypothetical protein